MADLEYSHQYTVYLSEDGIKFLTNPISISIMDMIQSEAVTLTTVSKILDIPLSSAQSNMIKLLKEGFVSSFKDKDDSRKTFYVPTAIPVITNADIVEGTNEYEDNLIAGLFDGSLDRNYVAVSLLNILPVKHGVSIRPMMEKAGTVIATYTREIYDGLDDEQMLSAAIDFIRRVGIDVCASIDGDKLKLRFNNSDGIGDIVWSVYSMASGFFMKLMSFHTKKTYCRKSTVISNNGMCVDVVLRPYSGQGTETLDRLTTGISNFEKCDTMPFAIYLLQSGSILFSNSTQIALLEILGKGGRTLKELSNDLDILPITIYASLSKLVEIGAVHKIGGDRNSLYRLSSSPLVTTGKKINIQRERAKSVFDSLKVDESKFFHTIMAYMLGSYRVFGIGFDYIIRYVGSDFARVMLEKTGDLAPQEFLKSLCDMRFLDIDLVIESYIPLKIKMNVDENVITKASYVMPFLAGLIRRGLLILTGTLYKVIFEYNGKIETYNDDLSRWVMLLDKKN